MDYRLYIMSSERSGSNLMRRILGAHSALSSPPAPQLWRVLSPCLHYYGDLSKEANLRSLINDALSVINVEGTKFYWGLDISVDGLIGSLDGRYDPASIFVKLYDLYAEAQNRQGWVSKENDIFFHASHIVNSQPDAKFIYLFRDGRDVAVSERKVPSKKRSLFLMAEQWKKEQASAIRFIQGRRMENVVMVRYEDLLEAPEQEVGRICTEVGLSYEENMLQFHEHPDSKNDAGKSTMWENLSKPILKGNKKKFKKEMKKRERYLYERVAAPELAVLGYPLEFDRHPSVSLGEQILMRGVNKLKDAIAPRQERVEPSDRPFHAMTREIREKRKQSPTRYF